ncbi:MAG: sensor histidine kinase [Pseudodesulfovibrio sp.]|nr:sensor histidine kinase [Pseudodesulfovibrio sp.]
MVLFSAPPVFAQPIRQVLILNSYNYSAQWTYSITRGVEETLLAHDPSTKIMVEFMDTKKHVDPEYYKILADQFRIKYGRMKLDAVITSDDNAVNFALKYRTSLFHDAPIIFCGVNNHNLPTDTLFTNITGIFEAPDIAGSLNAALSLDQKIETFYIVIDETTSGKSIRADEERLVNLYKGRIGLVWLQGLSMGELEEKLSSLPEQSAVLFVTFNRDRLGQTFTFHEILKRIHAVCQRPIYGLFDFYLGNGIVGGMLTSGKYQGIMAAELAIRIMNGENPDSIPVVLQKANRYMFDFSEMRRFGYIQENLPPESIVINAPRPIYETNKYELMIVVVLIVFLSVVIVILLASIRARKNAEIELEQLNSYQETLIEQRTEELTERSKELEIANYELKQLGDLKTAVLNTVSHDLRTPLTSVLGFCKIIDRDFKRFFLPLCEGVDELEGKGGRIRKNLSIIEEEGERLTRLINDFLDLSKIESGHMVWNNTLIDATELLKQVEPVLHGYFPDSRVSLNIDIGHGLPRIVADRDRLFQVFNNLVGNAAKFTEEGMVSVVADTTEEGWLKVVISDTGVGIPPDVVNRIFEKFYQVCQDESATEISRGSGMGLAISKRIIEHYGGQIFASSTVDKGSSFTFTIPST